MPPELYQFGGGSQCPSLSSSKDKELRSPVMEVATVEKVPISYVDRVPISSEESGLGGLGLGWDSGRV